MRSGLFQFNLLPPKSKFEREVELERDDSFVYALVLVFFGLFVYGALLIAQLFVLEPRIAATEQTIASTQGQVDSFQQIRKDHGELFIKTLTLEPLLDKDLDPQQIFRVGDSIIASQPNIGIVNYSREGSGLFVFEILSPAARTIPPLLESAQAIEGVSDVKVRSLDISSDNFVRVLLELNIHDV